MTFYRCRSPIMSPYFYPYPYLIVLLFRVLSTVSWILASSLVKPWPEWHIEYVCCKAFKILGLIMWFYFYLELSLKAFFCVFVHPILEYRTVVWDPHTTDNSRQLEWVQRRFLRFSRFLLKIHCATHNYAPVASHLGLTFLAGRHRRSKIPCRVIKQ